MIEEYLEQLDRQKKLNKSIVLWGIGNQTKEVIAWLDTNSYKDKILFIADNFKNTFCKEYEGVRVLDPEALEALEKGSFAVILCINYAEDVKRQLGAYEITEIYNLRDPNASFDLFRYEIPYHFADRSRGKRYLCYILAGYEPELWDDTIGRVEMFQNRDVDYCLISSGKRDSALERIADRNGWSYLWTEKNQVCFIQNLVIELHPAAEYMIKMDEDIFVGKDFFSLMIQGYHRIEREGEYRIGFVVPVVPLNCCGYATYLRLTGNTGEYEKRFGRAYKSRFSAVFNVPETARFLWDTMETFDSMADRFLEYEGYDTLDCYYNIGCIMFSRKRWMMMGKWPEVPGESGMGKDEALICQDNVNKDMAIYELHNVLAGHLAFGHQKQEMLEYYHKYRDKFTVQKRKEGSSWI